MVLAEVQGDIGCESGTFPPTVALHQPKLTDQKRGGETVSRRYSDFVWLLDCILRRYVSYDESFRFFGRLLIAQPFRILPSLPPKKMSPDAMFLEQRR